jgi:hypothetical protein
VSNAYPRVAIEDDVLHIWLVATEPVRSIEIDCVVDLTYLDEVIGVEVLDLRRQTGGATPGPSPASSQLRWAYDDEIDAFYLHVADGRGQLQSSATANASLDSGGRLVRLEIPVPRVA